MNNTSAGVGASQFSFVNGSGVNGFGALRWDGTSDTGFNTALPDFGIDRTGFAGVDFTAGGASSLKLTVVRSDAAVPFTLQFFSSDTAWTTFTFAAIPVCAAGDVSCKSRAGAVVGPRDFFLNYALMNTLGTNFGGGADFTKITAVQAVYNFNVGTGIPGSAQAVDFTIDFEGGLGSNQVAEPILFPFPLATPSALALIDSFDVPQSAAVDSSNGIGTFSATKSTFDASIIGGEREIYVNGISGVAGVNNTAAGVGASQFSFVNGSGVNGFGALRWDGTSDTGFNTAVADFGIDRTGFAGVDFTAVGDSLKLTISRSDAVFPFTLQFFSSDNDWTSFTFNAIPVCAAEDVSCLSEAGAVVGPTDFFFNYALMNALGTKFGFGADFGNITAVQAIYNFNGTAEAVDFTIDFASRPVAVPEPATLALLALGLAGLGFSRRKQ